MARRAVVVAFTSADGSAPPRAVGPFSNLNVSSLFVFAAGLDGEVGRVASRDPEGLWRIDDGMDDPAAYDTLAVLPVSERVSLRRVEAMLARVARRLRNRKEEG